MNISGNFNHGFWKKKDSELQVQVSQDRGVDEYNSEIESSIDFWKKYGPIVSLMKLGMKEGILSTLV